MLVHGSNHRVRYDKTAVGPYTLAAVYPASDRNIMIEVTVRETFADGSGAQPTFEIGETGTPDKFATTSAFTGLQEGDKRVFAGTLSATKELIVTATAATGTGTGAIKVNAVITPQSI